jgi:hypothetical protein
MTKRRWRLLLIVAALSVLAGVVLVSRRKPPPQVFVDRPRLAPGVTLRDVTFYSEALHRDMQYRVFVKPPGA